MKTEKIISGNADSSNSTDMRIKVVKENIERWLHELSIANDIGGMMFCEKMINKLKAELDGLHPITR